MMNSTEHAIPAAIAAFLSNPDQWGMSLSGTGAVYRLEQKFASLVGHPYALAVANATAGLWAVFMALEIQDADIVTTPYTWGGSLAGLLLAGNRPVFADIDKDTLTLDAEKVAQCITPRTKAILAVDIYGYPCFGSGLRKIADEYGLLFLQDCAQSFGAYREAHHTGWWADVAVFSLTVGKALFAGEGGMIVTRHQELFNRLVWQTQHPLRQLRDIPDFPANEMALNLRINPLAAVWAEATFEKALTDVAAHRQICLQILALLEKEHLSQSKVPDGRIKPAFQPLTFEPRCEAHQIEAYLREQGWKYTVCFPPIVEPIYYHETYRQSSLLQRWGEANPCPVAEQQRRRLRLVP